MNFAITLAFSLVSFTLFLFLGFAADVTPGAAVTKALYSMLVLAVPCAGLEGYLLFRVPQTEYPGEAPGSRIQITLPGIGPEAGQDDGS